MSIITMSTVVSQTMGLFVIGQQNYEIEDTSDTTGASSTRIFAPPRWTLSLGSIDPLTPVQSVEWEAMMLKMRGTVNRLAVWDVSRPTPRGTISGSLTLSGSYAIGAFSLNIAGASGTLKVGDWLQIGTGLGTSQLVKVMADATASAGIITVTVEPPLRIAFSGGTAVTFNQPVCYYKTVGKSHSYGAVAGSLNYSGHALDLIEAWN